VSDIGSCCQQMSGVQRALLHAAGGVAAAEPSCKPQESHDSLQVTPEYCSHERVESFDGIIKLPTTRYSRLSYRLYNRFDNRLYHVNKHPTACQTGCQTGLTTGVTTGLTTGLTTGCIV